MHVIHVATKSWLVIDNGYRPRYVIAYVPAVHQVTHETHMLYRVSRHHLDREHRRPVAWVDTYLEAVEWCRVELETPDMNAPIAAGYGSAVTVQMQRERWAAGLDPATGLPR